jgi:uncharacterized cupin superfamily protein
MKIIPKSQAAHVDKAEGSSVDYYMFPEYEVHYNEIKPGTVQLWHHHTRISETLFVIEGEIEAHWRTEDGEEHQEVVRPGDVIEVESTPHTFINSSDQMVKFIVFRFVPVGKDQSQIIKNDKVLD